MDNQRFVTFVTPVPEWMRHNWDYSRHLVETAEAEDDPWKKAIIYDFAKRLNDLDLARFSFESIGSKDESVVRYCHQLQCDGNEIRAVRIGSERPQVLERYQLNSFKPYIN